MPTALNAIVISDGSLNILFPLLVVDYLDMFSGIYCQIIVTDKYFTVTLVNDASQ